MRFSSKCGFSILTTVAVCVLDILSTFGLQNETVSHVGTTKKFPLSYDVKNTIINELNSSLVNTPDDQTKTTAIFITTNNTIDNEISTAKKRTKKNRRRRKRRNRRKRKGITIAPETPLVLVDENKLEATTVNATKRKRRKKLKRRKNKKNRRKQKFENSNILEVTTARGMIFPANSTSNSTIYELIRKLNENPEHNFEEFRMKHANKTALKARSSDQNVANLVSPVPPFAQYPIRLNDNITLHLNVGNSTNYKYGKRNNRCRKNKGGCAHFCRPKGKIKCSCLEGFALAQDQKNCLDIDECKENNGSCEMGCLNTVGSFECLCPKGLRLADDLKSCDDINECRLRNGHGPCQDTCKNSYGSYECSCAGLNGTMLDENGHSCVDLNECSMDNGGCSHICINTLGRAFCMCPDGMELSTDWKTCQDINECEDDTINQTCKNGCINIDGSYRCLDISEYQSDQALTNIACKPLFPPPRGFISCSRDGASHTYTKTGRKRTVNSPGTICKLICPVGYRLSDQFYLTCGLYGKWEGKSEAKCIPVAPPTLQCPPSQHFTADNNSKMALVTFSSPVTNINWKYVKSQPPWAKNLTATLNEGRYDIDFIVRDPATKLSASCSFKIIVKI